MIFYLFLSEGALVPRAKSIFRQESSKFLARSDRNTDLEEMMVIILVVSSYSMHFAIWSIISEIRIDIASNN
jgi:hypothetical protein